MHHATQDFISTVIFCLMIAHLSPLCNPLLVIAQMASLLALDKNVHPKDTEGTPKLTNEAET